MEHRLHQIIAALFITACSSSFQPENVQVGMTHEQVITLLGEPQEKLPLTNELTFWRYQDDHTVVVDQMHVVNMGIMTNTDYERTMRQMQQPLDKGNRH